MAFSLEVSPQSIAASSAANGNGVDMSGWNGVCFVLLLGAVDGTQDMKAQSDDNSGFSSATDITSAAITQVAGTGDDKIYVLDVWRPSERYVRAVVTNGAGATADFQGVLAIRYHRNGVLPPTQAANFGALTKVLAN
jgi:hypothetical protein